MKQLLDFMNAWLLIHGRRDPIHHHVHVHALTAHTPCSKASLHGSASESFVSCIQLFSKLCPKVEAACKPQLVMGTVMGTIIIMIMVTNTTTAMTMWPRPAFAGCP